MPPDNIAPSDSFERVKELFNVGSYTEASREAHAALSSSDLDATTRADLLHAIGECSFFLDDSDAAIEFNRKALEILPDYAAASDSLFWTLLEMRRNQEALNELKRFLAFDELQHLR